MNLRRLFATCLLALLVAACATTSLNKAESNTWLDLRAGAADFQTVSDGNMRHSVSTDSVSANDVFCKMYDMKMYFDQCFTFRIDR